MNANKEQLPGGGFAENVIIGQSTGGLVTRVALKEMEDNNEVHNTRLFVSYDSPQQGANVPLGYQHLGRHVRQLYIKTGGVATATELIQFIRGGASPYRSLSLSNTPAAQQMLINRIGDDNNIDNTVHNQWQTFLTNMGYPQGTSGHPLRVVSVSNGSECANPQIAGQGAEILKYYGKGNTRFLGDIAGMVAFPLIGVFLNQNSLLGGIIPGKNEIKFDVALNNIANGGGNRVYHNKITYKKKVLWLINVNATITERDKYAPSGILAFDSFPGGTFDTNLNLSNSSFQNWFFKYNITATNQRLFNFVPTTSALDIGGGIVPLNQTDYETKYSGSAPPVSPKNTPFANFTTATTDSRINEGHLDILLNNGNWLADELNGGNPVAPNCKIMCASSFITGPTQVCGYDDYSVEGLPAGASVTWWLSNNNGIASIDDFGSFASVFSEGGDGFVTLNAEITDTNCNGASIIVTKELQFGIFTLNAGIDGPATAIAGEEYEVYLNSYYPFGTTHNWSISTSNGVIYSYDGITATAVFYYPGTYTIYMNASSSCASGTLEKTVTVLPNENYRLAVYPNPSSSETIVEYVETDKAKATGTKTASFNRKFKVKLLNDKGHILAEKNNATNEKKITIDTEKIPNGIYYLHITEGKETIKKQIIIEH